jgi:hypothetical protein
MFDREFCSLKTHRILVDHAEGGIYRSRNRPNDLILELEKMMSWLVSSCAGSVPIRALELKFKGKSAWDDPEEMIQPVTRRRREGKSWKEIVN